MRTGSAFRTHPVQSVIGCAVLAFAATASIVLWTGSTSEGSSNIEKSPWMDDTLINPSNDLYLERNQRAWQIMTMCFALVLPFLELLTFCLGPLNHSVPSKGAGVALASTDVKAGVPAEIKPQNPLWRVYHYFFSHMSKTAGVAVFLFFAWQIIATAFTMRAYEEEGMLNFPGKACTIANLALNLTLTTPALALRVALVLL
jgi:hypothetical protein